MRGQLPEDMDRPYVGAILEFLHDRTLGVADY
jgi:hypothetical protein